MKTSEKLISVTCNPENKVCIDGSDEDRQIIQNVIEEIKLLEEIYNECYLNFGFLTIRKLAKLCNSVNKYSSREVL